MCGRWIICQMDVCRKWHEIIIVVGCQCFTVLNDMTKSLARSSPAMQYGHKCCSRCNTIDAVAKWDDCLTESFLKSEKVCIRDR